MKFFKCLSLSVSLLLFAGCAGYRVGSTLPESIQTVSLLVKNQTDEPSIEVAVMKALRAELQMDGRLEVVSPGESDTVLKLTLTQYHLNPIAYDRREGTLAREYRAVISGSLVFYDANTDEVIVESPGLLGETEFEYAADLTSAKLGALPEAAADLARKAVSISVMAW